MKREPKKAEHTIRLRLWTYEEASKALPYLRGVAQSIRDHWLEMQQAKNEIRRLDIRHGRPNRNAIIQREEAVKAQDRAEDDFEAGVNELLALSIYVLDPTRGQALIPFRQGDELAWYVFDMFAPEGLESWRFHQDPVEMRRPLPATATQPGTLLAAV